MKHIYFARSLRGAEPITAELAEKIKGFIRANGCATQFSIPVDAKLRNQLSAETYIYTRDLYWLDHCCAMIAEVSDPSHGVGYEIAYAQHVRKIPTLLLAIAGTKVSAMLQGGHVVRYYGTDDQLEMLIGAFSRSLP